MLRLLAYTGFFLCINLASAQFHSVIRSGRPGMMMGVNTVGKSVLQIQSGLLMFKQDDGNVCTEQMAVRWGWHERFEVSAQLSVKQFFPSDRAAEISNDLSTPLLGFRIKLIKDYTDSRLNSALQFRSALQSRKLIWSVNSRMIKGVKTGLNLAWQHEQGNQKCHYVFQISPDFLAGWQLIAELHGFVPIKGDPSVVHLGMNGGLGFFINDNLKIDTSIGLRPQASHANPQMFANLGFSWRTHWRKDESTHGDFLLNSSR